MRPLRGRNRAGPAAKISSHRAAMDRKAAWASGGAFQAEASHPEGESELFANVGGVEAFCLSMLNIENDLGYVVNFCFEAAELVVAIEIGDSEFDVVEILLQGSVEENPFDLGIEGKGEEF